MVELFLDLETIPAQRPDVRGFFAERVCAETQAKLAEVRAPSNYKDEAKIDEYIRKATADLLNGEESAIDAEVAKTGLDGAFGQIVCIGWAAGDGPIHSYIATDTSLAGERKIIEDFFCAVYDGPTRLRIIGHNVANFDLRFLRQRAIVHGLYPPAQLPFNAKPWDDVIFDTMIQFAGIGKTIGQDRLCLALGLPCKGEIDGSMVWPLVQAGEFAKVAAYCARDVETVRAIYKRMTFSGQPA